MRAAHGAIKATGKPIQLETAIVYGDVGSRLLKESRTADLISVGSVGFGAADTVLPLAPGTVIEETPGVRRFQAIRTAAKRLTVRLETRPDTDPDQVWHAVDDRLREFLTAQGAPAVVVERSPDPPAVDPTSGKFRQVWSA